MVWTVTLEEDRGSVLKDGEAYHLTPAGHVLAGTRERMEALAFILNRAQDNPDPDSE